MAKPRLSEAHLARQKKLHDEGPPGSKTGRYGISGHKWATQVQKLATESRSRTILDYGAGAMTLERELSKTNPRLVVTSYDPVTAPLTPLLPADMVVCTDVLEQCEMDQIGAIVDDIGKLAQKAVFIVVAMHPETKYYDGLLIRPVAYWTKIVDDILSSRFRLRYTNQGRSEPGCTRRLIVRGLRE